MNALTRVLKNEKYSTLLLLFLLVFNSAVFYNVAAKPFTPSASASNLYTVVDKDLSPQGVSMNAGVVGNMMNVLLNKSAFSDASYSQRISDCQDNGLECKSLTDLQALDAMNPPSFNSIDAVASLNVTLLDQRPVSAVDYFQGKVYALTHFNTVSAQAAVTPDGVVDSREAYYSPGGTGFSLLKPIQNFWSWSVRVVYGFLLVIVIIIAFAIMFRQRLSGNVEVTVQNAIPAIALAMILVPLSYAISGLFIDFITVGTNAVHEFFIGAPGSPGNSIYLNSGTTENLYTDPLNSSVVYPDRGYYPDDIRVDWLRARDRINVSSTFGAVGQDVGQASGLNGNVIFLAIGSIVNALTGKGDQDPADFTWIGDIVQFFISIVTLWIGIQVFVALFKKYMTIILYPVISPFIFATIAIPGNGTKSIMQYVKVMAAAALAYIVTYAMFLLSIIFTSQEFLNDVPTFASASFNPPLIGLRSIGIGSNEMTQLLLTLIGLGIYFSIPSTLKSIDQSLGADNPLPKFITTPIDSFRESQRVMFKTAPALAGRVTGTGARLAGNAAASPFRAFSGAMDIADRARGIDPEKDYRSYRNRQRAARADRAQNTKERAARYQQSGNIFKKVAGGALNALDSAENSLAGQIEGTGTSLPSDVQTPKVTVSGNDVVINRQDLLSVLTSTAVGVTLAGRRIVYPAVIPTVTLLAGSLEFKVEGPSVNLAVPPKLVFGSLDPKSTARNDAFRWKKDLTKVEVDAEFAQLKYKDPLGAEQRITAPVLSIVLDGNPKPKGTDMVKQDFRIVSSDLPSLLGDQNGGNNAASFVPIAANAKMRSGVKFEVKNLLGVKINGKDDFTLIPLSVSFRLS